MNSLVNYQYANPLISNTEGTGPWAEGDPFNNVQPAPHWTSTTAGNDPGHAWFVWIAWKLQEVPESLKTTELPFFCVR
jgi:hypothetical protein